MTVAQMRRNLLDRFGANGEPVISDLLQTLIDRSGAVQLLWEKLNKAGDRSILKTEKEWPANIDEIIVLSDSECYEFETMIKALSSPVFGVPDTRVVVH